MKTIVGIFDQRSDAQAAVDELERFGIPRNHVSLVEGGSSASANSAARASASTTSTETNALDTPAAHAAGAGAVAGTIIGGGAALVASLAGYTIPGFGPVLAAGPVVATITGAGIGAAGGGLIGVLAGSGIPEEDAAYYTEGVRRGGTLVSVAVDDAQADSVGQILARHNPVDVDERAQTWRASGWEAPASSDISRNDVSTGSPLTEDDLVDEPSETSSLGSGGVTSTIPSTASRSVGASRSTSGPYPGQERQDRGVTTATGAAGSTFNDFDEDFRSNFGTSYSDAGYTYEQVQPAYRYGYDLASRRKDADWTSFESDAQRDWEARNPGTWDRVKNSVRYAYDRARQKLAGH